jgi:hypothetical protein
MIFGKTYSQRLRERDEIKEKQSKEIKWFAWRPVELKDGRIVWLQYVYRTYRYGRISGRRYWVYSTRKK